MDRPHFFFSFELSTRESPRSPIWAALEVGGQVLTKTSCSARLDCAEWSFVVLSDSPRGHNGSGSDWPYKSATRPKLECRFVDGQSEAALSGLRVILDLTTSDDSTGPIYGYRLRAK